MCVLQMILYYKKHYGTGLPLHHTLTIGLHIAAALWHLHPSVVHRYSTRVDRQHGVRYTATCLQACPWCWYW